jgi:hypothetical protein
MVVIVMMSCLINVLVTSVCLLFAGENRTPLSWTYGALLLLYVAPPVITVLGFSSQFAAAEYIGVASPISAMLALPLDANLKQLFDGQPASFGNMTIVNGYFTFGAALSVMLVFAMLAGVRARQEDDQ